MPPLACSVYELPSLPFTVTPVALFAVTVNTEELPAVIDDGFAVMVTVGAGFDFTVTVVVWLLLPPALVAVAV